MESKHSLRKSKLFRALLILLLIAVPVQWAAAQLTLSTPRTTLGTVIKQIQSQSKYQFFYNDKLSTVTVEPLKVKDASLEQVLNTLLKNKDISYKIEENIIYLSEKENSKFTLCYKIIYKATTTIIYNLINLSLLNSFKMN